MFALRSISTKKAPVSRVASSSFNGIGQRMFFSSDEFETGEVKFFIKVSMNGLLSQTLVEVFNFEVT